MAKIDEQISYNWLFFLLAAAFAAVTFWAVYDEAVTRREYKAYQETFFDIEAKLAENAWTEAKTKLESSPEYQKLVAEKKQVDDELRSTRAARYKRAQAALQDAIYLADEKTQDFTFIKSRLDALYYEYTVAKHAVGPDTPSDSAAARALAKKQKEYDALEQELKEAEEIADEVNRKRDALRAEVDAFTARSTQIAKAIEDMSRTTDELERKYKAAVEKKRGLFGPATEIIQQNLEDLGRVDRCESCHVGSSRGGFETVSPKYFASHPLRRTLFGLHPVEKFGCTTCHDGQGRATTKFHAHAPTDHHRDFEKHFWEYPLLKGPFVESMCRQCHRQQVELRSYIKCEIDEECPTVAGQRLRCAPLAVALNPAANLAASIEARPDAGRWCGTPNAGDSDKVDAVLVDLAPHLSRGRKILEEVACHGCHPMDGYDDKRKAGPDLRHAAAKLNPGWMVEWLLEPRSFRPHTRMPNFFPERVANKKDYPAKALPQYIDGWAELAKIAERDPDRRARALQSLQPEKFQPEQQAVLVTSFILGSSSPFEVPQMPPGDAQRGEELVDTLGCYGCHDLAKPGEEQVPRNNRASHFDHGPELGNIGAKTSPQWIYAWMKNPKAFSSTTRMPDLRLSDQEAADIATFLGGLKQIDKQKLKEYPPVAGVDGADADKALLGQKLVRNYGCYGCHLMKGFETTAGVGVDLSDFGLKEVSRLDYGDYIVKHTEQTWEKWLQTKLARPHVYRYERVDTRMPEFDLTDDEIADVMVVLKGMRGRTRDGEVRGHELSAMEEAREKGRELVRWYNCYGCHTVDGHDGDIRQQSIYRGQDPSGAEKSRLAPPMLLGQGAKTQPGWLFGFLKSPTMLRPSLTVRMPTFGLPDPEATTIVQMFSALDGADFPFQDYSDIRIDARRRVVATSAFEAAQCLKCHSLGATTTPEQATIGAPNLLLTKDRLRGDWLLRWLRDPQVLYPGVNMPSFFTGGMNPLMTADKMPQTQNLQGIGEITKMSGDDVITLLRDLMMNLEGPGPSEKSATPAR